MKFYDFIDFTSDFIHEHEINPHVDEHQFGQGVCGVCGDRRWGSNLEREEKLCCALIS
jgi:hypothetical protein